MWQGTDGRRGKSASLLISLVFVLVRGVESNCEMTVVQSKGRVDTRAPAFPGFPFRVCVESRLPFRTRDKSCRFICCVRAAPPGCRPCVACYVDGWLAGGVARGSRSGGAVHGVLYRVLYRMTPQRSGYMSTCLHVDRCIDTL